MVLGKWVEVEEEEGEGVEGGSNRSTIDRPLEPLGRCHSKTICP